MSNNRNKSNKNKNGNNRNGNRPENTPNMSTGQTGQIISDALDKRANINFSWYPGSEIIDRMWGGSFFKTLPSLVKVDFIPTVGDNLNTKISPINVATTQLFAAIRAVNSGAVNYSASNLMIFVMSMKSIISYYAYLSRILGLVNMYSSTDFNIPWMFYEAFSVDLTDIRKHRVDLAAYLDEFAANANTLSIPNCFPILRKEADLCSSIYTLDESNNMGQYLMFEPRGFYRYEENESSGEKFGTLQWEPLGTNMKYDDLVAYGDRLLRDARTSEDHYVMCGDIRKAFSESSLVKLDSINSDYEVVPKYDKTVLDQLHNARLCPVANTGIGEIAEDHLTEAISQTISLLPTSASYFTGPIAVDTVDWDTPENQVAGLLRWAPVVQFSGSNGTLITNGPEILTNIHIYHRDPSSDHYTEHEFGQYMSIPPYSAGQDVVLANIDALLKQASLRTMVGNCLPFQYFNNVNSGHTSAMLGKPRCTTIIQPDQVKNINRLKFLQDYGVGEIKLTSKK